MESEITNAETSPELPLAEPHFDDEATVLSARRVVPLDEVPPYGSPKTSRLARRWMFAAIVLGSLLLGVVGSAAYYSYLNRRPAQPFVDTEAVAAGVDGMSTEPAPNNDASAKVIENENPTSLAQPADSAGETRRPIARRVAVLTFPSNSDEQQARDERKAARKEAKERKRQLERESRRSRDDLTRIREIFEGPQKP
jgi:hypothetical protein